MYPLSSMILRKKRNKISGIQEAFLSALQRYAVLTHEKGALQLNPVMSCKGLHLKAHSRLSDGGDSAKTHTTKGTPGTSYKQISLIVIMILFVCTLSHFFTETSIFSNYSKRTFRLACLVFPFKSL